MSGRNFAAVWQGITGEVPDREAIVCGGRRRSWREFDDRASRLASHLHREGLRPGGVVAIDLLNTPEYLETFFAALKLGCVPVNVNYRYVNAPGLERRLPGARTLRRSDRGAPGADGVEGWRGVSAPPEVPAVDPGEARRRLDAGAVLLDVREPHEWDAGHAPEAIWIPKGTLDARLVELPTDRPIVVVCGSGGRSARVTSALIAAGYDATNVAGGMKAWAAAGFPVFTAGGGPGAVA